MAGGSLKVSGVLVQMTIDTDVPELSALKTDFVVAEVVLGKGCIMITDSPPDFSADDNGFFFIGQRG